MFNFLKLIVKDKKMQLSELVESDGADETDQMDDMLMDKEEKIIAYKVVMNKLDNFLKEHDVL